MHINKLDVDFKNILHVLDGHEIEFHYPTTRVSGLVWGDRTVNIEGTGVVIDLENDNRGTVVFNPTKPSFDCTTEPTSFEGMIYTSQNKKK